MNPSSLSRPDILRILHQLGSLARECCLTSGAALVLYGVKKRTRDVDLICGSDTAQLLLAEGCPFHESPLEGRIFGRSKMCEIAYDIWEINCIIWLLQPVQSRGGNRWQLNMPSGI